MDSPNDVVQKRLCARFYSMKTGRAVDPNQITLVDLNQSTPIVQPNGHDAPHTEDTNPTSVLQLEGSKHAKNWWKYITGVLIVMSLAVVVYVAYTGVTTGHNNGGNSVVSDEKTTSSQNPAGDEGKTNNTYIWESMMNNTITKEIRFMFGDEGKTHKTYIWENIMNNTFTKEIRFMFGKGKESVEQREQEAEEQRKREKEAEEQRENKQRLEELDRLPLTALTTVLTRLWIVIFVFFATAYHYVNHHGI